MWVPLLRVSPTFFKSNCTNGVTSMTFSIHFKILFSVSVFLNCLHCAFTLHSAHQLCYTFTTHFTPGPPPTNPSCPSNTPTQLVLQTHKTKQSKNTAPSQQQHNSQQLCSQHHLLLSNISSKLRPQMYPTPKSASHSTHYIPPFKDSNNKNQMSNDHFLCSIPTFSISQ